MKLFTSTFAVILIAALAACSGAGPDTSVLKALLIQNNADGQIFAKAIETATEAPAVVEALVAFTEASKTFTATFKAETEKHPEFIALSQDSLPADLKDALEEQIKTKQAVGAALVKLNSSPLLDDAAVADAYQKLADAAGAR